jgi:hypothetical protein
LRSRNGTLAELLLDSVDRAFVANLPSAMLTHERGGRHHSSDVDARRSLHGGDDRPRELPQEDAHLGWAKETRPRLMLQFAAP